MCNFKPKGSGRVDMELMIKNNTDFPINSVTGQVRFVHDDQDVSSLSLIMYMVILQTYQRNCYI